MNNKDFEYEMDRLYRQGILTFFSVFILLAIALVLTLLLVSDAFGQVSEQRQCVVDSYTSHVGVREATGRNDGQEVEKYLLSTGLNKGYAWCAAFVNWNFSQCGIKTNNSPWSPAWFPESRLVYSQEKIISRLPLPADVFGIWFRSKQRIAHVGFVYRWPGGSGFVTVEGNTNETGSREGDGVYKKWRLKSQVYSIANWIDDGTDK